MAVGVLLFLCKLQFDIHARSVMSVNDGTLTDRNSQILLRQSK
jgi:hypothetical protein